MLKCYVSSSHLRIHVTEQLVSKLLIYQNMFLLQLIPTSWWCTGELGKSPWDYQNSCVEWFIIKVVIHKPSCLVVKSNSRKLVLVTRYYTTITYHLLQTSLSQKYWHYWQKFWLWWAVGSWDSIWSCWSLRSHWEDHSKSCVRVELRILRLKHQPWLPGN